MSEIHSKLIVMLDDLIRIIEKNNLRYYIIAGSQLGAVRHGGFIPWDDDIDIAMPRKDYEHFVHQCANEFDKNRYFLSSIHNNEDHRYLFAKFYCRQTTLVEDMPKPIVGGLYIDIFPLDGVKGSKRTVTFLKHEYLKRIFSEKSNVAVAPDRRTKHYLFKITTFYLLKGLALLHSKRALVLRSKKYAIEGEQDNEYLANHYGAWGLKEIVPTRYFGKAKKYSFEKLSVMGVEYPHEYLSHLYGDYMKLPPVEKRKSHHRVKYMDLNLPYALYHEGMKHNRQSQSR